MRFGTGGPSGCARLRPALAGLLAFLGCTPHPPNTEELEFGSELVHEVNQLRVLFGLQGLFVVVVAAAMLMLAYRGVGVAARFVWRVGLDGSRRLQTWATAARVAIVIAGLLLLARRLAAAAPVLLSLTLLAAFVVLLVALARELPSVTVGLRMLFERRLRQGDRVYIAGHSGTVRDVSITQLELRKSDGSVVIVPNRLLADHVLTVEYAKNSEPLRVRIPDVGPVQREQLELARRVAALSPYRVPGSLVELLESADGHHVEIHVWGNAAAAAARAQLEQSLASALARPEPTALA